MSAALKFRPNYKRSTEWLPVAGINVHAAAQRPFDEKWARYIADNLDPDALGFPAVARVPNGKAGMTYYAVDGQHRIGGVRLALGDDQLIECEIIDAISIEQAAKIFRQRNKTRGVRAIDQFLAGITAKDAECVQINDIVTSLGIVIDRNARDGTVSAVGALVKVYRGDKAQGTGKNALALKRTLGTALNAWGRTGEAMNGQVIEGLGAVVLRYGDTLDFDALEKKLRQFKGGALGLLGAARGLRESFGGSVANCVAHQIVILYNRGRGKHQLRDWNRGKGEE